MALGIHTYMPDRSSEIDDVMWNRILKVLSAAHKHGHKALVLGAWGCGAFGNDGNLIASLFKKALKDNFKAVFEKVGFAITDWSTDRRFIGPFLREFQASST